MTLQATYKCTYSLIESDPFTVAWGREVTAGCGWWLVSLNSITDSYTGSHFVVETTQRHLPFLWLSCTESERNTNLTTVINVSASLGLQLTLGQSREDRSIRATANEARANYCLRRNHEVEMIVVHQCT